ncbi:unnamed protein product [Vicia faba]|uniref:Uncharacterized protein n=1 Tax=Vicia faba TaxID=3906 RepID=A0AAV0ZCV3_VICFA|nr:unnamed protein product [Vicia faba]
MAKPNEGWPKSAGESTMDPSQLSLTLGSRSWALRSSGQQGKRHITSDKCPNGGVTCHHRVRINTTIKTKNTQIAIHFSKRSLSSSKHRTDVQPILIGKHKPAKEGGGTWWPPPYSPVNTT